MTQDEALAYLSESFGWHEETLRCTGDVESCPVDECSVCAVRTCPERDILHFHHDGCPSCETSTP